MDAGEVLNLTKEYVDGYAKDNIPILIAVADLKNEKIFIELTIQRGYPLDGIWRDCGRPFGKDKNTGRLESDLNRMNRFKWPLELHENLCKSLAYRNRSIDRMCIPLSTGAGNILQNKGSVAWLHETKNLYKVGREEIKPKDAFACLVQYRNQEMRYGIENLSFEKKDNKWFVKKKDEDCTGKIDWALNGYPLILGGVRRSLRETATHVSDFRHIWQLPQLYNSLTRKIFGDQPPSDIWFYYGLRWLTKENYFKLALEKEKIKIPLSMEIDEDWIDNFTNLYGERNLLDTIYEKDSEGKSRLIFDKKNLALDFQGFMYEKKDNANDVISEGDFFIGEENRQEYISFYLRPAIYPHHIIGIEEDQDKILLYDISIAGKPGRSGITIEKAKDLCEKIGMRDALIIDNGFDVIARMNEGLIISHKENTKPPRLTAAIHFGCELDPQSGQDGNHFEGIELSYSTKDVTRSEKVIHPTSPVIKIFFCYSHHDRDFRDQLDRHLQVYVRRQTIITWSDRYIVPGAKWDSDIAANLLSADIVLVMISVNFFNSYYAYDREMTLAIEQGITVIPILTRECFWRIPPIRDLQVLPPSGRFIESYGRRNRAYTDITQGIIRAVEEIAKQRNIKLLS